MMNKNYDLTNYEGYQKATSFLKDYGWIVSPIPWLIFKISSPEISTEKQVEAAKNLIIAGKENGVKKLKIKVGHEVGIELGATYEQIPIKAKLDNKGFLELEVEYS